MLNKLLKNGEFEMSNKIKLFENQKIRASWNAEEEWYFSVVDIIAVLTESENPQT